MNRDVRQDATASVVECPGCGKPNRVPAVAGGWPRCAVCHADLPWLTAASEHDFADVIRTRTPVLVDLWAPWCGPCRTIAPGVERTARELAGHLKIVKVNVDVAPSISARFGVQGIPTLLILRDGSPIARHVGALSADRLLEWARRSIDSANSPT